MNEFSVSQVDIGDVKVLVCSGRMEGGCYEYCRKMIGELLENRITKILFDMGEVEYVSSTGWAIFVSSLKKVRDAGGDIKIANMRFKPRYIFKILELENIIDAFGTVEEAIEAFIRNGVRRDNS